jgi:MOSC domain-containing protein YiiM
MPTSSNFAGIVRQILISRERGGPMVSVSEVKALAGRGLVGDRHLSRTIGKSVDKNLTLIESEKILDYGAATGLSFTAQDARRNIVTSGIELNPLVGNEFYVGAIRVRALELCEPCSLLARRTQRAVLWGLAHKGGLRCQILTDGVIQLGDTVRYTQGSA